MSEQFLVREGIPSDAKALNALAVETFCDAFAHFYSPDDVEAFLKSQHTEELHFNQLQRKDWKTLLVVHEESLIGFATIRFGSRDDHIVGTDPVAEIYRFYISKPFIGKGIAKLLMDRALEVLQECKTNVLWLGVWENSHRAKKFYQKYGFQEVGHHEFVVGKTAHRDLLYQLNLNQME